ncbi:putative RNA-binding Zn ribbon-like protein [Kribbella orskensis]|uniref:RNA-binding Zn ribbon-like protein n=1 Tax=Kribbella orskensis TaxID=2512216 RepID=A0ABY2BHQ3_9ACTN|nr:MULTISPECIES: ABATE domain-containing protein [Kribbella]TCN38699.1 putative RNA-binding Zn ribbon-like protein [Kribbella sp. VKM Ac-2500]TCO20880.1 putative RNA-binding Zn ribbon-like protein [Kribbella orskensis]
MEYPLLGTEPLVVEFANTRYDDRGVILDYLASAELLNGWFTSYAELHGEVDATGAPARPVFVPARDAGRVQDFRDHVHRVLAALADGKHPGDESIAALNDCAAQAHSSLQLEWSAGETPVAVGNSSTTGTTRLLADLATDAITLAAGPDEVVRCQGPDCRMLFVKTHPRRQFCDPSCGQRARQARYYRRRTSK